MTPPQPIYGLTTTGSSEDGSKTCSISGSSSGSNVASYSNESSQAGCVDEVFSELRVEEHALMELDKTAM